MLLGSRSGLRVEVNDNGSLRRFDHEAISVLLFVGNELEGGPANLYLRSCVDPTEWVPLLGPSSPTQFESDPVSGSLRGSGSWKAINYSLALVLANAAPAWFWHIRLENTGREMQTVDLTYAQDLALASYGAVRMNEFYVSQYVDHTPLAHPHHGTVIGSRQNQATDGKYPWCISGSLRKALWFGTDALQLEGLALRGDAAPAGLIAPGPAKRLQHEHSMIILRDEPIILPPGQAMSCGFFGRLEADHPAATGVFDLERADAALSLAEARPPQFAQRHRKWSNPATVFTAAPPLRARDLGRMALERLFATPWRHEEFDERGQLLSFFCGTDTHVVLGTKELRVLRPHGHLLRTGLHLTPDESALTSTVWMGGVFHSMVTQGHVSINRFLSTVHSYIGLFRSHGVRAFLETEGAWQLLDLPSAFEMSPQACRWIYSHKHGVIEIHSAARSEPHELTLTIRVIEGASARFLISHHVALNGDDGSALGAAQWRRNGDDIVITAPPETDVGRRFPHGNFSISVLPGTALEKVGGDELLFVDGLSRQQPFVCLVSAASTSVELCIRGNLIDAGSQHPIVAASVDTLIPTLELEGVSGSAAAARVAALAEIVPWLTHNALVHYLSPRGLEQYSGGGWGTRDVCQGPVEMLLATGQVEPVRDLLLRVMRAQNRDGDWPQWFMFFERERNIRPGDSHGDIIFWPLLVLAQYLLASGDTAVLEEQVPFFDAASPEAGERATVWQHAQRALNLIGKRVIAGTALAAYGHGDWNDSLQPADPRMREHLCSSWTVTLNYQVLVSLARALRSVGREQDAAPLELRAEAISRDFQRLLVADRVLTGYASFEADGTTRYLLHPRDETTGVHFSSLAMIHAILEDLLTPGQVREHLRLIDEHLRGPDGVRLFDRPMPYHGGPQRIFQRAETATFFGREIGLMYMHAHLRYAQALAHVGEAERFFEALCQANPVGIRAIVPTAALRQANCYYSSSDAAFDDRYQASTEYERVAAGAITVEGGWRVYSSGAGIALGLILRHFLGLSLEANAVVLDPVIPASLDGLSVRTRFVEVELTVRYEITGSGCGVTDVILNDWHAVFTRDANRHRPGAARLALDAVRAQLKPAGNLMTVKLGR